jgi:TonB family protein
MAHSNNNTPRYRADKVSRTELFQSLEPKGSRARAFWTSVAVHGVMVLVLGILPLVFTETMRLRYDVTFLTPPPPRRQVLEVTHWKQPPRPKIQPRPEKKIVAPPPVKPYVAEVKPPEPKPVEKLPPVIERAKPAEIAKNELPKLKPAEPAAVPVPAPPKPEVKTNVFSTGSSATPTVNLAAHQVQTGGFGDPNGARGEGKPGKPTNIASLGSFDLPVGEGAGNGTGGARGVRGVVASAGFGNGVAPVGSGGGAGGSGGSGGSGRGVSPGSFGDATAAAPAPAVKKPETGPPQTQVEILSKPRPEYTTEARSKKIEGEVLVGVLFTASGEARVLNVIRGLGSGLDENAVRAAQQIKFKPAQRDGQPVDSTATVHIVFQLAY